MAPSRSRTAVIIAAPMALAVLLFLVYPVLHGLIYSLFDIRHGSVTWLDFMGYRMAFQDRALRYSLVITVLWSTAIVTLTLFIGSILASRMYLGGRMQRAIFTALLLPWAIPVYIAVPLWRALLYGNGGSSLITWITGLKIPMMESPLAGFCSAMAVSVWMQVPFTVFIFYSHLKRLGREPIESARIEGCSPQQVIRHICIPQLRLPMLMLIFLNSIGSFKEFSAIFLMTGGGPPLISGITDRYIVGATTTIGVFLYQVFQGMHHYAVTASFGVLMALGVGILLVFWRTSRIEDETKRARSLRGLTGAVHLLPLGALSWLFGLAYLAVYRSKTLFTSIFALHLASTLYWISSKGVLEGLNPALMLALIVCVTQGQGRKHIALSPLRETLSAGLYQGVSIIAAALLGISSALLLYMLLWLSISSADIITVTSLIPPFASIEPFKQALLDPRVWRSFLNTAVIASGTAVLLPILVLPASAAVLERGSRSGDRVVSLLQLAGAAGGIHTLIPLFFLFSPVGLLDTRTSVILVYTSGSIPTAMMISMTYLEQMPRSISEAAALEGATTLQRLRYIFLPLSLPAAATCALVGFVSGWNGFLVPLLFIRSEELYPVSLQLYRYVGGASSSQAQWSAFAALSIINMVLVVLMLYRLKGPMGKTALQDYIE